MNNNLFPYRHHIGYVDRNQRNGHKSIVVWFTGLSGSGKTTIANALEEILFERGYHTYILDGDTLRNGLNNDLDFSKEGRKENIRRAGEVAKLFTDAGIVVLASFISPYSDDRTWVKQCVGEDFFYEIYVDTPLEVCEARDPRGLYSKARAGELSDFTGISAPYEEPVAPFFIVKTLQETPQEAAQRLFKELKPLLKNNNE